MLILQIIAFLILVFVLGKWVYPWLIKSVDERQDNIEAATKAAADAQAAALNAEARVEELLVQARSEAAEIVATAKLESSAAISASEDKAKKRAEQIVSDASADIAKQVVKAKEALHNETIELVALAAEKVIGKKVDAKIDDTIIRDALKAVR
jgi:F-type H+-transporting ATPase subunit b